jgi:hypothetical protein
MRMLYTRRLLPTVSTSSPHHSKTNLRIKDWPREISFRFREMTPQWLFLDVCGWCYKAIEWAIRSPSPAFSRELAYAAIPEVEVTTPMTPYL